MRPFLTATAALTVAFGLAGCDAADRAALAGAKAPASIAQPAAVAPPTPVNAALLFPPASPADAPRLTRVSTAPHPTFHPRHRRLVHVAGARRYTRVHTATYVEQTVIRPAYGDQALDRQTRRRVETSDRWDERRSTFAEAYDRNDLRAERAPTAAGRDRDGFLTWPGKISGRR